MVDLLEVSEVPLPDFGPGIRHERVMSVRAGHERRRQPTDQNPAGSNVEHDTLRLDLFAFGATPAEAGQVMHAAALRLKRVQREVWASTLLHWVQSAGGFASGREPDTDWPRVFQSFQTLYAMETVS